MTRWQTLLRPLQGLTSVIAERMAPTHWKQFNELHYWKRRKSIEGTLSNDHYQYFYTKCFGLEPGFYEGKVVMDIGCGPRGSLEWADMAWRRIGVDPLANEYLALGARMHRMEYLPAPAESIPIGDSACDIVASFNSLDHVANVERVIAEMKRVTRAGGTLLLMVEVNHPPTACEPHELSPDKLISWLAPEFTCVAVEVVKPAGSGGIYESVLADAKVDRASWATTRGFLVARFSRGEPNV